MMGLGLTFVTLLLVLRAAVVVLGVVGQDQVVPELRHDQPHLAGLEVEKTGFVTYLREIHMLKASHTFPLLLPCPFV